MLSAGGVGNVGDLRRPIAQRNRDPPTEAMSGMLARDPDIPCEAVVAHEPT
jgi:hypothetical protein